MKKTYEKNDVKSAAKTFTTTYIFTILIFLYLTDIITEVSDVSLKGLSIIRAIICFIVIILASKLITINVMKKYKITNSFKDNIRFNINLVIIGVAVLSIFYFLITLNNNVNKVKKDSRYSLYASIIGDDEIEAILQQTKAEAKKGFITVWVSILAASAIAVGTEGKCINKYCYEDELNIDKDNIC